MTDFVAAVENAERAQLIVDLKAARAALVARGRCRHVLIDPEDGKVCVWGAIGLATVEEFASLSEEPQACAISRDPRPMRTRRALELHLDGDRVWAFNDYPETTDQDVLDLFDKTLADLGGLA